MDYYNQEVIDILRWGRIGDIACCIAKEMKTTPLQALKDFYRSTTCSLFHDHNTGLYLYSDAYIAEEYMLELRSR